MIYLDNAATTKIAPDVFNEMLPYLTEQYGNPGSKYRLGRDAYKAVELARSRVASFINAKPEQIIFTSGGSEANNLAVLGLEKYLREIGKTEIITTPIEHKSMLRCIESLCMKDGFHSQFLPVKKDGRVRTVDLQKIVSSNTGLVSVMHTNNETGVINPIHSIGKFCRKNNILFLSDCVQAAGCHSLDVEKFYCDFLSISGHKIHAPKGSGVLYVRDKTLISPIINGGNNQEFGLRGGTENVANIVGFGKACELLATFQKETTHYLTALRDDFYKALIDNLSALGCKNTISVIGQSNKYNGKVLNLFIDGVDGETLVLLLDSKDVCISSGSACNSIESVPSHVLTAMGISEDKARSCVRISFSIDNDEDDVRKAAIIISKCIFELRQVDNV